MMNTNSIKFYYNGIKVNGGKLIRCFYSLDNDSSVSGNCVSLSVRDYSGDLPRDCFEVRNETDHYTDYFDTDRATLTAEHPLYKYARAAAIKSFLRDEESYINKHLAPDVESMERTGREPWPGHLEAQKKDLSRRRVLIAKYRAELNGLPTDQPTAADLEKIDQINTAAENARRQAQLEAEQKERESVFSARWNGRKFVEAVRKAYPLRDGSPVVEIGFSECPYLYNDDIKKPLSVAAANVIFAVLDKRVASRHRGYDKTDFVITYTDDNGEKGTYEGRYDLGDDDGGLIEHIRAFGSFYLEKGWNGNGNPSAKDKEKGMSIIDFADMLQSDINSEPIIVHDAFFLSIASQLLYY